MREILTVTEAAAFLNKHPDTIRRWIKTKKLSGRKLPAGKNGIFVLLRSDLLELVISREVETQARLAKEARKSAHTSPRQVRLPI